MRNGLMLNLGCGSRTHPAWVNIDYSMAASMRALPVVGRFFGPPLPVGYRNWDLRKGIPYDTGTVSVVYSSHVLEHIDHAAAPGFLRESARVLRPGGVIRTVVPDLEASVLDYCRALQAVREDTQNATTMLRYELATIMLLDQMVRRELGGELAQWLRRNADTPVVQEKGGIFTAIANSAPPLASRGTLVRRVAGVLGMLDPVNRGEVHRWMYDEISLTKMLRECGFRDVVRVSPSESRIAGWEGFNLDADPDGTVHQPGSLWIEATKA